MGMDLTYPEKVRRHIRKRIHRELENRMPKDKEVLKVHKCWMKVKILAIEREGCLTFTLF